TTSNLSRGRMSQKHTTWDLQEKGGWHLQKQPATSQEAECRESIQPGICKRKADGISRNNQQPLKRQNVAKAYNLGSAEKRTYEGNAPKSTGNTNATNNQGSNGPNPRGNGCFEYGNPGHFKRDCPKLKKKDGGNGNAHGWV
nr:hypothetical protein [Tanacetum cinerariifolium]